jgi:hypothetical protein
MRAACGALAVGLALCACSASPDDASPAITATPAAVTAAPTVAADASPTPVPSPLPTLPPGEPARVLLRHARLSFGAEPLLTLYDDGMLLTLDDANRLSVRWMTARGIRLLRAALIDTGLFGRSANFRIQVIHGVEPPGVDLYLDRFRLAMDGGEVVVNSTPGEDPSWMVPSPERDRLADLATQLRDISWLPDEAWADAEAVPYQAAGYLVFSGTRPLTRPRGPDLADVEWPFPNPPDILGDRFALEPGHASIFQRCQVIGASSLSLLNLALARRGFEPLGASGALVSSVDIPWRERDVEVDLMVRPLLPDEAATCEGKQLPPRMDL